jgi:hypothetical protein
MLIIILFYAILTFKLKPNDNKNIQKTDLTSSAVQILSIFLFYSLKNKATLFPTLLFLFFVLL